MKRSSIAAALALFCVVGWSLVPAEAATPSPCENGLATVKARLKKAEASIDNSDLKNSGARKHYKAALSAHRAFDDPTCLSELGKAESALDLKK
jgi:shikimate kinase